MNKSFKAGIISGWIALIVLAALSLVATKPAFADRTQTNLGVGYLTSVGDAFSTVYYNAGYFDIGSSAASVATLYVQGYAGSATSTFSVASSTGQKTFDISSTGTTTIRQYIGFGTPTVATSTGAGIPNGTSTLAVGSTDLAGSIYLITGSVPATSATIFTLTGASSTLPFCIFSPMTATAAALTGNSSVIEGTTTTGFKLSSGSTGLTASTTYQWNYLCS